MSKAKPMRRDKPATVAEPAKPDRRRGSGTPALRRGSRLSPGDAVLEREADNYAGGIEGAVPSGTRKSPKGYRPGGEPLPERLRELHELRLGRPLDGLRVHAGAESAREADALGARAFADQGDLVFAEGRYHPDRPEGQALIAHEVAHAAQQADGRAVGPELQPEEPLLLPAVPAPNVVRGRTGELAASVYFGQGDFLLDLANARAIEELRRGLSGMLTGARVVVDAHASGEGGDAFNQELSDLRRFAVLALLTQGITAELELKGKAWSEASAAGTETAASQSEREALRALNRRVDIVILPNLTASPPAAEPERRPIKLEVTKEPEPPIIQTPEPEPWARPQPSQPEPSRVSVCGTWSDDTRRWFDRRLRERGVGKKVREFLAERGVGLVQGLTFGAIGELAGEAGASATQVKVIESTVEAACRQEVQR